MVLVIIPYKDANNVTPETNDTNISEMNNANTPETDDTNTSETDDYTPETDDTNTSETEYDVPEECELMDYNEPVVDDVCFICQSAVDDKCATATGLGFRRIHELCGKRYCEIQEKMMAENIQTCCVCLVEILYPATLPYCTHVLHIECKQQLLDSSCEMCPMCRAKFK